MSGLDGLEMSQPVKVDRSAVTSGQGAPYWYWAVYRGFTRSDSAVFARVQPAILRA